MASMNSKNTKTKPRSKKNTLEDQITIPGKTCKIATTLTPTPKNRGQFSCPEQCGLKIKLSSPGLGELRILLRHVLVPGKTAVP
jgi:hypothetical protein